MNTRTPQAPGRVMRLAEVGASGAPQGHRQCYAHAGGPPMIRDLWYAVGTGVLVLIWAMQIAHGWAT